MKALRLAICQLADSHRMLQPPRHLREARRSVTLGGAILDSDKLKAPLLLGEGLG